MGASGGQREPLNDITSTSDFSTFWTSRGVRLESEMRTKADVGQPL
jgi:hypothetical protein